MSWHECPQAETLAAPAEADPIEVVILPRSRDLGGFEVRRALPSGRRRMVGPFIFFDQMGPSDFLPGAGLRLIAGQLFDQRAPVATCSETLYADVELSAGAALPLDPGHEERAIYVVAGDVEIGGRMHAQGGLLVLKPGEASSVRAVTPARLLLLGGDTMDGPRHIWWNFVSSRKERIEQAKSDWREGRFEPVPDESEFIPLPAILTTSPPY